MPTNEKKKLRLRPVRDPERLQWPPGRSDVAAGVALVVLIVFLVAGQWVPAIVALVLTVGAFVWPTAEQARAAVSPDGTIEFEAKRVDARYVVVDESEESEGEEEPTQE